MHLLLNKYNIVQYYKNPDYTNYTDEMKSWNFGSMVCPLDAGEYIYIGCPHTFTSRFIVMGTVVNDVESNLIVEYYYGQNNWRAVKNLTDETRSSGVPLSKSGFIAWDLPDDWMAQQINSLPELPYGSSAYDGIGYYWIRIRATDTLKLTTNIKWLGMLWTNQEYIRNRWQEFDSPNFLPIGKTDWYEVIEMSTGDVGDDLNISNIIDYELQIKDIDEVAKLTALKTLINILIPMTSSETLKLMKSDFEAQYIKLLGKRLKNIDRDQDEKIGSNESIPISNTRIMRF